MAHTFNASVEKGDKNEALVIRLNIWNYAGETMISGGFSDLSLAEAKALKDRLEKSIEELSK